MKLRGKGVRTRKGLLVAKYLSFSQVSKFEVLDKRMVKACGVILDPKYIVICAKRLFRIILFWRHRKLRCVRTDLITLRDFGEEIFCIIF